VLRRLGASLKNLATATDSRVGGRCRFATGRPVDNPPDFNLR
jgi:hypothetical protein